jgi:c-di-GMP-binding flagellar brake protein YcgR
MKDEILYETARRYPRTSADVSVRVFVGANRFTNGRGHDIGAGGMAVYVPLELPLGTSVNLSFQLPHSRTVLGVRAVVRNRSGFRYGVEFMDLSSFETEEIKRLTEIMNLSS